MNRENLRPSRGASSPVRGTVGALPGWVLASLVLGCSTGHRGTGPSDDQPPNAADAAADAVALSQDARVDARADAGSASPFPGCRAVDVLFVIDNSGSMADQQASLIASFDGFVTGMRERLADTTSFHLGVVTTDSYRGNEAGCQDIGDLVTQTGGPDAAGQRCGPFASGARYLSQSDDLSPAFRCIAQVGTGGDDDERAARAVLNAIDPSRPCNVGFIRDDAVLVVVVITDEDDVKDGCSDEGFGEQCESYGSGGRADDWLAELRRHRDPESVVMMTLLGQRADNACGAVVAARLLGFARRFNENGHVGDVCASSYDTFFRQALPIIGDACVRLR
ncbi:MAG: hypothetical protein AAGF12_09660 [Myxococcota bacterium]